MPVQNPVGLSPARLREILDPAALSDVGQVYVQDDAGDSELFYRDDKDRETQITVDGALNAAGMSEWFDAGAFLRPLDGAAEAVVIGALARIGAEILRVTNGAVVMDGVTGATPASGAGTRLMWVPAKAAVRAGLVTGARWDDASVGANSAAFGRDCQASGSESFAAGDNCRAGGTSSLAIGDFAEADGAFAIALGRSAEADENDSVCIGVRAKVAAGATGAVALGEDPECTANADQGFACGKDTTCDAQSAVAMGKDSKARHFGCHSHAAGVFAANGDAQTSLLILRRQTTTATPAELFLDGAALRAVLQNDTTWLFRAHVAARRTDVDGESAAYVLEGAIDRGATAATTALVGTVMTTILAEDSPAWDVVATADTTNGALVLTVTGEAAKTIRWVAQVVLVEVTG